MQVLTGLIGDGLIADVKFSDLPRNCGARELTGACFDVKRQGGADLVLTYFPSIAIPMDPTMPTFEDGGAIHQDLRLLLTQTRPSEEQSHVFNLFGWHEALDDVLYSYNGCTVIGITFNIDVF